MEDWSQKKKTRADPIVTPRRRSRRRPAALAGGACLYVGSEYHAAGDVAKAALFYGQACAAGSADGCYNSGGCLRLGVRVCAASSRRATSAVLAKVRREKLASIHAHGHTGSRVAHAAYLPQQTAR